MILRKIPYYEFKDLHFFTPADGELLKKPFYLALPAPPLQEGTVKIINQSLAVIKTVE